MAALDRAIGLLYEARARPDRMHLIYNDFSQVLASFSKKDEQFKADLAEFFENMQMAHGSKMELERIAEDLDNWMNKHRFHPK